MSSILLLLYIKQSILLTCCYGSFRFYFGSCCCGVTIGWVLFAGLSGVGGWYGLKSSLEEKRGCWGREGRGGSVVLAFGSLVVGVVLAGLVGVGGRGGWKSG
jgi:hypothetical protein